jgi:hypothetical protein
MKRQKRKKTQTKSEQASLFYAIRKRNPSEPGSFFICGFDFLDLLPIIGSERFLG